jgi:hypothetical protein
MNQAQHAEVPAIEQKLAEPRIEPRQRPDRQNDGEHEEGAGAEGTDAHVDRRCQVLRGFDPVTDANEGQYINNDPREQDAVIDELRSAPLHRLEPDAHRCPSIAAAGAGGGARITSDIARAVLTSKASSGQSTRWTVRCEHFIADDVIEASGR